ncbi:MAG: hypothetical protein AAF384_06520 [Pseudomonadota bacterium]
MASTQSGGVKDLYRSWVNATAANPEISLQEMRELFAHWGDITGEPGGLDYLQVDAAVEVSVDVFPEMQHVFQFFPGIAPEGDQAVNNIAEFLRAKMGL